MNPVRGIETKKLDLQIKILSTFKLMNPVRGIETLLFAITGMVKFGGFQINESRSRD